MSYWTFNNTTLCENHAIRATQQGINQSKHGHLMFPEPIDSMVEFVLMLETFAVISGHEVPETLRYKHSEEGTCLRCWEIEQARETIIALLVTGDLPQQPGGDAA